LIGSLLLVLAIDRLLEIPVGIDIVFWFGRGSEAELHGAGEELHDAVPSMLCSLSQLLKIGLLEPAQGLHLYRGEKPVVEVVRTLLRVSGPPDSLRRGLTAVSSLPHPVVLFIDGRALLNVLEFNELDPARLEIRALRYTDEGPGRGRFG
jgi:hypothetical protein